MDGEDREKYIKLYYRLATIQDKINELNQHINSLDNELDSFYIINDKPAFKDKMNHNKERVSDIKESLKDVRQDIKNRI